MTPSNDPIPAPQRVGVTICTPENRVCLKDRYQWCNQEIAPGATLCSRAKGHDGGHIACAPYSGCHNIAVWPNATPSPQPSSATEETQPTTEGKEGDETCAQNSPAITAETSSAPSSGSVSQAEQPSASSAAPKSDPSGAATSQFTRKEGDSTPNALDLIRAKGPATSASSHANAITEAMSVAERSGMSGYRLLRQGEIVQQEDEVVIQMEQWAKCDVSIGDAVIVQCQGSFRRPLPTPTPAPRQSDSGTPETAKARFILYSDGKPVFVVSDDFSERMERALLASQSALKACQEEKADALERVEKAVTQREYWETRYHSDMADKQAELSRLTADRDHWKKHYEEKEKPARVLAEENARLTAELVRVREENDKEIGRWQDAIYDLCCKRAPKANIDGAGCDSGDPLDLTLAEIGQMAGALEEDSDALHSQLTEARARIGELEKDFEWLEEQAEKSRTGISFDYCRHVEEGYVVEKGFRFMRHHHLGQRAESIRKAIELERAARTPSGDTPASGE